MKGLILCGGKGTRLRPFTHSLPKTLLPVAGKPVLDYCLEHLIQQGIKEIGIVLNPYHQVIRDYLENGDRWGVHIHYIYQNEPKGISHAVYQAEQFIDKEPFILLLGDNLISEGLNSLVQSFHLEHSDAAIMLAEVETPSDFGIAQVEEERIIGLEEKPQNPKSNLAVIGAYLFNSHIFQAVSSIVPSKRGEYEITDAIQWLIDQGKTVSYSMTKDFYSDVGTVDRWLDANEWMMKNYWDDQVIVGKNTNMENCTLHGPVYVGNNCILKNAEVGPYVFIHDTCQVSNCRIDRSILLKGSILAGASHALTRSAIGREVKWSEEGSPGAKPLQIILGDKSLIQPVLEGEKK